jgi:hypothetical protein
VCAFYFKHVLHDSQVCDDGTYINITITIPDIIHRPGLYLKLNSIGLSVHHSKHITSPLRAQQVNAICRFVAFV